MGNVANVKVNLTATSSPSANDDNGEGYAVGSQWINTTANLAYVCVDATDSAAVWIKITLTDTDELDEGTSNLYYTEARVSANTSVAANTTHSSSTGNAHSLALADLVTIGIPKQNLTATSNPTTNDDKNAALLAFT